MDLFVNDDGTGYFYFYQNNGTPQWPDFSLVTSQRQGIEDPGGWRGFCFGDLDADGDLYFPMAHHTTYQQDANLRFYRNDGTLQIDRMTLDTSALLQGSVGWACPYLVDIDLDGGLDLFCGEYGGGIMFFRNVTGDTTNAVPTATRHSQAGLQLSLNPNPANPNTVIGFILPHAQEPDLMVYNPLWARLTTLASGSQPTGGYFVPLDARGNSSGVHVIRLETSTQTTSQNLIIIK